MTVRIMAEEPPSAAAVRSETSWVSRADISSSLRAGAANYTHTHTHCSCIWIDARDDAW